MAETDAESIGDTPPVPSITLVLDADEIDALARYHRRAAAAATKAGRADDVAAHASRADDMLAARIASTMERREPEPAVMLNANGYDQSGALWAPVECGPGVRMVPLTSGNCLAIWQAYTFEATRQVARQNGPIATHLANVAGEFLRVARELDPNLSVLAENPPGYVGSGFA